jgi:hypothetical protein
MYFSASVDNEKMDHAQSDCIELQSKDLSQQQGLYKCTTHDATHFVCLKVTSQPVQVLFSNSIDSALVRAHCNGAPMLCASRCELPVLLKPAVFTQLLAWKQLELLRTRTDRV